MSAYDFIGDIHGQHEKLIALLTKMGYSNIHGVWQHATRKAFFVGDFIDRGPGQLATLKIVRNMIEAGHAQAVMGNHEFNAIAWATQDPQTPGQYLRKRTEKNRVQHIRFLEETGDDTTLHQEWINWFYTLPLWFENEAFRAVHACWHPKHIEILRPLMGPNNTLTPELVEAASRKGRQEFESLEVLCKGLEIDLPPPITYTDKEGTVRTKTRTKWWNSEAITYRTAAMINRNMASQLPEIEIPEELRLTYDHKKPLFFGHYWFTGTPGVLSEKVCCVDFSAAIGDFPLVAYRYDGEHTLSNEKLITSTLEPQIATAMRMR